MGKYFPLNMKFTALPLCGAIASTTAMDVSDNQEKLYELM